MGLGRWRDKLCLNFNGEGPVLSLSTQDQKGTEGLRLPAPQSSPPGEIKAPPPHSNPLFIRHNPEHSETAQTQAFLTHVTTTGLKLYNHPLMFPPSVPNIMIQRLFFFKKSGLHFKSPELFKRVTTSYGVLLSLRLQNLAQKK